MTIKFTNLSSELELGAKRALKTLGLELGECGLEVSVSKGNTISVKKVGNLITITYLKKIHFFRALGLMAERIKKNDYDFMVEEMPQFDTTGVMPDLSKAPMSVDYMYCFMDYMAVMGLNMMLLYVEDIFSVPSRKYFGYMKGRYTEADLRAMDDYAFEYGIELIPCIQTLGHLQEYLRWGESADIRETANELNVDTEATYKFIEDMIVAITTPLRSKRVHIGMDETWGVGRGEESLRKYGLRNQADLFINHLQKVAAITDRLGLKAMIWNDFIFCLHSESGGSKYDLETQIPQEIMDRFPKNVQLVYWHYGEEVQGCDEYMIQKNQLFGNDVIFAGGLMMWTNALPDNMLSYEATEEGLLAAKKCGLREVFTTLWLLPKRGCDYSGSFLHLQQYAEHTYNASVTKEQLAARFEACTGASYEAFMNMSQFGNIIDGREYSPYDARFHGQKYMWDDVLLGKYDLFLQKDKISGHYKKMKDYYEKFAQKRDKWYEVYHRCAVIFDYLAVKTFIGENLQNKYLQNDREFLVECEEKLFPELLEKTKALHECYRNMWFTTRKSIGWERIDERFGGMEARIVTAICRLRDYNNGVISAIEELDEIRLPVGESMDS